MSNFLNQVKQAIALGNTPSFKGIEMVAVATNQDLEANEGLNQLQFSTKIPGLSLLIRDVEESVDSFLMIESGKFDETSVLRDLSDVNVARLIGRTVHIKDVDIFFSVADVNRERQDAFTEDGTYSIDSLILVSTTARLTVPMASVADAKSCMVLDGEKMVPLDEFLSTPTTA